jgi:hypothetical protein
LRDLWRGNNSVVFNGNFGSPWLETNFLFFIGGRNQPRGDFQPRLVAGSTPEQLPDIASAPAFASVGINLTRPWILL